MRVEFYQHDNFVTAEKAAKSAVESYFIGQSHQDYFFYGAIDGVPISRRAGFPEIDDSNECYKLMELFVVMKFDLMNTALVFEIKYNENKIPEHFAGSFFIRVQSGKEIFLEINFREELDETFVDPEKILGLTRPEDFSLAKILMVGQRKLSTGNTLPEDENCKKMNGRLMLALLRIQNQYKWENYQLRIPSNKDLHSELFVRAAKLGIAMIESGFHFEHGTLGPKLKQLAEQYLV
jgi:hypothetical protein